jgi:menaquinone-dependent protoporphyrinogen IX oxidase
MNKTIIIYDSRYGHTKKYAQWLAEELNASICEIKNTNATTWNDYSTFVFGSSLYAGRSKAALTIVKHFKQLRDKKVVLFTCGVADVTKESNLVNINKALDKVITSEIRSRTAIFHLRGGIDYANLNFIHKAMMKMVYSQLSKKPDSELTDENRDVLATYGQTVDFSNKEMLAPIIQYCRENQN